MDYLLHSLFEDLCKWISNFGLLSNRLLLLLTSGPKEVKNVELEQYSGQFEAINEEEEKLADQHQDEMKKVRFSDEESDEEISAMFKDKAVVSNGHSGKKATGNQNGNSNRSVEELESELNKHRQRVRLLSDTVRHLEEEKTKRANLLVSPSNPINEQAKLKIDSLEKENQEKETIINDLRRGLSNALEHINNGVSVQKEEEMKQKIATFEADFAKLEQKLMNANEEKEYYKKHFNSSNSENNSSGTYSNTMNGSIGDRDDFGRELMQANKRKYQLESKVRILEHDLKEAQQTVQHLDRSLKNSEKCLWLEKERSATLEHEKRNKDEELNWLKLDNENLKRQIEILNKEKEEAEKEREEAEQETPEGDTTQSETSRVRLVSVDQKDVLGEIERLHKDYDVKITDILSLKNQLEWRLGEVTKNWNDAKWRVGELESALAHKEYELDQSDNRIKQLESVLATPVTNMTEEINYLREELRRIGEEKSKAEWRLGEVTQYWNDAKWRIGELEGEVRHKNQLLQNHGSTEELRQEVERLRQERSQLDKAFNDSKWRVGELEAEVGHKNAHISHLEWVVNNRNFDEERNNLHRELDELRDQKSKVEWRLGEVVQYWNDAKWRQSELQNQINQKDVQLKELYDFKNRAESQEHKEQLYNSFVLSKQHHGHRHQANILSWDKIVTQKAELRRVWFDVNSDGAKEIFLIGSFLNWECALLCETFADNPSRKGVWIDLPPGRHEFRFIKDGKWETVSNYQQETNEFGGTNNWMQVE